VIKTHPFNKGSKDMKDKGMKGIVLAAALILLVSGCTLSPKYSRPENPVKGPWTAGGEPSPTEGASAKKDEGAAASSLSIADFLANPKLKAVVDLALKNNRDLKVAALNMERAAALYRIQRSALAPHVDGTAKDTVQQLPDSLSPTGTSSISRRYDLNVGISAYELDFFGRVRSLKAAALETYLATEQAKISARLSIAAETASAWLTLAADKERLKLARETLKTQEESCAMIAKRTAVGAASELALHQAETSVASARLDVVGYTNKMVQDENALALIVGSTVPADLMPSELDRVEEEGETLKPVSAGLDSSVLLSRPDVLTAEGKLRAACANIGAARAAFFPRITLTGTFGAASSQLDELFKGGPAWSFIPQITVPIFDAGNNRANLDAAKIDRDIALANYEKAIQTAFREVSDALSQNARIDGQLEAQKALLDATDATYRLSDIRYKGGIDSYLNVLDAQRSLYSAQQARIDLRFLKLVNRISLYKALGGGTAVDGKEPEKK
jgi:multidrug efflux system outer membrane protein